MTRTCLVIGGNGFIGKNLVLKLLKNDFSVVVFDVVTNNIKEAVIEKQNVHFIEGDINNTSYLIEQIENIDSIVWLIHTTVPATSMFDVEFDLQSNIPPLIRFLLHIIKSNKVRTFIYLSSGGAVYGNPDIIASIDEKYDKNPISSYGLTKLVAEEYISFLMKSTSVKTFILRPSNVYGKYQNLKKPQGLIGHVFKSVLVDQPITIYGDGTIVRDYLHVDDLSQAIILCINNPKGDNNPVALNVGSGIPTSINEIISNISEITQKKVNIISNPPREFDCKYNVLSIDKAREILSWKPNVELKAGMKEEWEWILQEFS